MRVGALQWCPAFIADFGSLNIISAPVVTPTWVLTYQAGSLICATCVLYIYIYELLVHFEVVNGLKPNFDILLTRPDKSAAVVILNCTQYIKKNNYNFGRYYQISKTWWFITWWQVGNLVAEAVSWIIREKFISTVYDLIRHKSSQRPRMYGLPKIHKSGSLCALFCPYIILHNMHWRFLNLFENFIQDFVMTIHFLLLPLFINSLLMLNLNFWCLLILLRCLLMFLLRK